MKKKWIIAFGTLLSLVLLIVIFANLDWQAFWQALRGLQWETVALAISLVALNIALRSLRWNLIADMPLTRYPQFWQAANIGYLGNIIYPAKAGEVLRVIAAHHFVPLPMGRALSSAVIDRMLDLMVAGALMLIVLWIHGSRIEPNIGKGAVAVFIIATVLLFIMVTFVDYFVKIAQNWPLLARWQTLHSWVMHGLEGIKAFRQTHHLLSIFLLSLTVYLVDYYWMWQIMWGFGWYMPYEAALTVGAFIIAGASLPSAPGYIGIYQVACVLALGLYGIDQSLAVAYSIVLQLLTFSVMGLQGGLVAIYRGFNLNKASREAV